MQKPKNTNERRTMNNEKDHNKQEQSTKENFWTFCEIEYKNIENKNKKVIIEKITCIALKVGNKFYLKDLKTKKNTKLNHIKILNRFDFIPAGASKEQIDYFKRHLCQQSEKLNIINN